jgi:alkylation response protein AidB-like acyl-CoA dehydrogenase
MSSYPRTASSVRSTAAGARTTLANERVAMSSTGDIGGGLDELLSTAAPDPVLDDRMGALVGGLQSAAALGLQITLRQLGGLDPGPSSSVRKLAGMYQIQDARELALEALGASGAVLSDPVSLAAITPALSTRALTIAGGSSQVLRNVIAERLLGLPRD